MVEYHAGENLASENAEQENDLVAELRALLEYKWQILGVTLVCVLVTALVVFSTTPTFRATSTLQIEPKQQTIIQGQDVYDSGAGTEGYYATQYAILESRELARKAVSRIDWEKYPDFIPAPKKSSGPVAVLGEYLPFIDDSAEATVPAQALPPEIREKILTDLFLAGRRVEPLFGTQLVKVLFLSKDNRLAKEAANVLADVYIESGLEAKLEATERATDWLNRRLGSIRTQLEESEGNLQEFRETNNLVNIDGGRGVIEAQLTDNMQRLRDSQRQKTSLQNTYEKIQQARGNLEQLQEIPVLLGDELVRNTKENFLEAKENVSQLSSRYGPKHPSLITAEARLAEARAAYESQLRNAADGVRAEYQIAAQNVRSLNAVVQSTTDEIKRLDRKQYQSEVLKRESETNSELYNTVLSRFKEADAASDYGAIKAQVVDPAILPITPYLPNKKKSLLQAALFGLFLGCALALIRRRLEDSIKTGDELEAVTGVPVFSSIPVVAPKYAKNLAEMAVSAPKTLFSEAIRTIRTGIVLSDVDRKNKRIIVTSTVQLEGKSSIACNLAAEFGQLERVLLIDGDMRRPTLGRYMGLKGKYHGLTSVLSGDADIADALHPVADGVDLLPVGEPLPTNPAEIMTSDRFRQLLEKLSGDYDRVIIDSAPVQPVSDTLLLGKHADAIVLVVRFGGIGRKALHGTIRKLRLAKLPVLGAVLNCADAKTASRYGDSYYYGQAYYG